ncbi:uncharacterized protein [Cherax quadricarinatus]|uniref:uncharacterized protein isoform X2 n=1 Tax=Cherax quadricarinatus TaxID=27406 RepID=UPI00387E9630
MYHVQNNNKYWYSQVQETIKEALATITTGATAVPLHLPDSDSTIIEKVEKITDEFVLHTLTVEDLLRMSERVKRLVEAGRVFAVQQGQDDLRYSRITLQDGQLYLHTLLRQPPPSHAHTLKVTITLATFTIPPHSTASTYPCPHPQAQQSDGGTGYFFHPGIS